MAGCYGNRCTAISCRVGTAEHSVEASLVGLIEQVATHTFKIV